jgi:antitoxin MazE
MLKTTHIQSSINSWGNGMALRITKPMADAVGFTVGTPVRVEIAKGRLVVRALESPKESLASKLARFDPALHGGEVMADEPVGRERL